MSWMKKLTAIMLVVVMTLGMAVAATADSSPSEVPSSANPNYDPTTRIDTETAGNGAAVEYEIAQDNGSATVVKIEATGDGNMAPIGTAHDENNNEVTDITIGDGTNGVLDNKNGQKIITLQIDNGSKKVIIKANALKNSKVTKVIIKGQKSKFEKNVFKGTKKKTCRIYLKGAKKAKDVSIAKGAFNGLGKNSKVYLSKKMDKKEYKKLVNKLRKAGFKGKIVRN